MNEIRYIKKPGTHETSPSTAGTESGRYKLVQENLRHEAPPFITVRKIYCNISRKCVEPVFLDTDANVGTRRIFSYKDVEVESDLPGGAIGAVLTDLEVLVEGASEREDEGTGGLSRHCEKRHCR